MNKILIVYTSSGIISQIHLEHKCTREETNTLLELMVMYA